jgi:hypothetical protein
MKLNSLQSIEVLFFSIMIVYVPWRLPRSNLGLALGVDESATRA